MGNRFCDDFEIVLRDEAFSFVGVFRGQGSDDGCGGSFPFVVDFQLCGRVVSIFQNGVELLAEVFVFIFDQVELFTLVDDFPFVADWLFVLFGVGSAHWFLVSE